MTDPTQQPPPPGAVAKQRFARQTGQWAKQEIEKGEDPEDVVATLAHRILDSQDGAAKSASRERLVWAALFVVLLLAFAGKEFVFDGLGVTADVKNAATEEAPDD